MIRARASSVGKGNSILRSRRPIRRRDDREYNINPHAEDSYGINKLSASIYINIHTYMHTYIHTYTFDEDSWLYRTEADLGVISYGCVVLCMVCSALSVLAPHRRTAFASLSAARNHPQVPAAIVRGDMLATRAIII